MARILLSGIFTGQALYVLYSLAGGILCFLAMAAVSSFLKGHYIFLTSIVGSCFHNLGQILIALAVTKVWGLWAYFPILVISGVLTGLFTGLCAHFSQKYIMPHVS